MKIERDVGIIESVVVETPSWVDAIFEGDNDAAVMLLVKDNTISFAQAKIIVGTFSRKVIFARKVEK